MHDYQDTFGVRVGGAYNFRINEWSRLTARLGGYFDSAATKYASTRLDFNTAAKWALTAGVGLQLRGVLFNVAYAYVWSPDREVKDSAITAVNANNGTAYIGSDPVIAVGNGRYEPSTHILSMGATFHFDDFNKPTLPPH
jgi:long-subunit fatty acid transport protein